jgi:hypothetical protein
MSNDFYNASGSPSARSNLSSQNMRVEFSSVATAFNKLPALTGNGGRIAKIKNDATAMEASSVLFDDGSSVMVGASATRSIGGVTQRFYVESTDAAGRQGAGNVHNSTTAGGEGASLALGRSRGSALSAVTAVAVNDGLGQIKVFGADGTSLTKAATIEFYADGAVSAGVVPGRISFKAATTGGVLTEQARITSTEFRADKVRALDGTSAVRFNTRPLLDSGDEFYKTLQDLLASTSAGNGAAMVGFDWALIPAAINKVDWGIQTAANAYNALRQVTPSQWAAILNYTSTDDHSAAIQAAVNSFGGASSVAQGTVYLPAGQWNLKTAGIVLPFEVSVRGTGGRATKVKVWGDWDAFSWSATIPSFSRQVSITDLWLIGPGYGAVSGTPVLMATAYTDSSAGTNLAAISAAHPGIIAYTTSSGININHPYGIDFLNLNRLFIEEFPTYGVKTNQTGGSSVNCFQFGDWSSLYFRYCNIGMLMGIGFTGESTFTNICSQFNLTSCLDISINGALVGAQGLNFNGLIGGWSPNGVRVLAGTAGNLKFDMLHMEHCTTAGFYSNSGSIVKIILESPWLAANTKGFLGDLGGHVCINNGTWQGAGSATDNFIKLNAASNFSILLSGQHTIVAPGSGSAPTDHISTTDINTIKGFVQRKSSTLGTINSAVLETQFLQARGITSETGTVFASNLGGNTTIGNGVSSVAVTFGRNETDTNYRVAAAVDWGAASGVTWIPAISIGSKAVSGFTAYFSSAAPAGGSILDWIIYR